MSEREERLGGTLFWILIILGVLVAVALAGSFASGPVFWAMTFVAGVFSGLGLKYNWFRAKNVVVMVAFVVMAKFVSFTFLPMFRNYLFLDASIGVILFLAPCMFISQRK